VWGPSRARRTNCDPGRVTRSGNSDLQPETFSLTSLRSGMDHKRFDLNRLKPEAPEQTPEQAPRTWKGSYLPPRTLNARLFEKEVVSPSSFSFLRNNLSSEFRPGKGTVKKSVSLRASLQLFLETSYEHANLKERTCLHMNKEERTPSSVTFLKKAQKVEQADLAQEQDKRTGNSRKRCTSPCRHRQTRTSRHPKHVSS
jgi:hypothetical protein